VFKVPQAALLRDAAGPYVLVVGSDGKVARKDVVTDVAFEGNWIVTQGLAVGDQVIVSGIQRAKPGEPAKGTPWQPDAPDARPDAQGTPPAKPSASPGGNPGQQ